MKFFNSDNTTMNSVNNNIGDISRNKTPILFEKSATYFDNDLVPRRVHALLPNTKLVRLLYFMNFLNINFL